MLKIKHMFFVIDVHIHKYVIYDLQIEKCIVSLANLSSYEQYTYEIWLRILKSSKVVNFIYFHVRE